jgi:hypothetical protein
MLAGIHGQEVLHAHLLRSVKAACAAETVVVYSNSASPVSSNSWSLSIDEWGVSEEQKSMLNPKKLLK